MTYYFFNIDPLYRKIFSNYDLFSFLKRVHLRNKDDNITEIQYKQLTKRINQSYINKVINNAFLNNRFYEHKNLFHFYNNKYRNEMFTLKICNNMLIYNANYINNNLIKSINNESFFICNFDNQDYFWINEISC